MICIVIFIYLFAFQILDMVPPKVTAIKCFKAGSGRWKTCPALLENQQNKKYVASKVEFCSTPVTSKLLCGSENKPVIGNGTLFAKDFCRVTCNNPPGKILSLDSYYSHMNF